MEKALFDSLQDKPAELIQAIKGDVTLRYDAKKSEQIDPKKHRVFDIVHRPNKQGMVKTGTNTDGSPIMETGTIKVSRIAIPLQRLIVKRSAAFLTGGKMQLQAQAKTVQEKAMMEALRATWKKNKLQYRNGVIARAVMTDGECCEVWFGADDPATKKKQLRSKIFRPSKGYELYPVLDEHGDMIAFGIAWKLKAGGQRYRLYTSEHYREYEQAGGDWEQKVEVAYKYGKIPVVYFSAEELAWEVVQALIEKLEDCLSDLADTNRYFGNPMLKMKGEVEGLGAKGETGRVLQMENGADAEFLTWDQTPESIKLEIEMLFDLIFTGTQTPNISFKELKGLGDISGVAFERIMIDAYLKAIEAQEGEFGEGIQRRINFLMAALASIDAALASALTLEVEPVFGVFKIDSVAERIDTAMKANGGQPVMSHKSSIAFADVADDPEEELLAIQKDLKAKLKAIKKEMKARKLAAPSPSEEDGEETSKAA